MPRNIRWDESVKENALNLVEALLYQADDELDDLALKAAVHVEWVTENKLRVTGKQKQTRRKRERVVEVGTRKEHLLKLVKKAGKSLNLPQRKKESGSSQPERELEEVQTALDCLRELGVLEEEKNTRKNQGYWKFTLTLKHQTAIREQNLEVVQQKWKGHPKTKPQETSLTTSILETEKSLDWQNICRTSLEKQKQLTTNRLMSAKQMLFDINQICVDLALVERKQPDKRSGDDNPEQSQLYKPDYEETQKLEYEEFLATVLKASQSNKIAIIGEPGAGKTTILQRIAFWILDNTDGLPIWIPLGNFPTPASNLKKYLLNNWLEDAILSVTPKIRAEFEGLLTAGRVWLLLDGVDEMVANSGNPLSFIDNWILGWSQHLSVVLTCRLNVWEANPHALYKFQTYRTLEFSQEKVNKFIEDCFQNRRGAQLCAPTLGEQLQQALNQPGKERIKDLIRNPLRLTLLCSTWHWREGKLPDTKAELYQQFVEEVYRWKKDEFPTTPEERKQLNAKLKELALEAIDKEENRFCLRHKFVESVLGERDGSVFQLALNIGWLNRVGVDAKNPNPNQPVYAFFHPTFQEYFAALAIKDWDFFLPRAHDNHNPKPVSDRYRIFESQWKEVILLWLGREDVEREQKKDFIEKLVKFKDGCGDFYWYRAYFLTAAGITEFAEHSLGDLADDIVAQLVQWAFGYFDTTKPAWLSYYLFDKQAKIVLRETLHGKVITELTELLHSCQNEEIRRKVAESNGKTFDERIIGKVALSLLELSPGNIEATQALKKLINNSHDYFVPPFFLQNLDFSTQVEVLRRHIFLDSQSPQSSAGSSESEEERAENSEEIIELIDCLNTIEDSHPQQFEAMSRLQKIVTGNPEAIPFVLGIITRSLQSCKKTDYYPLFKALECLQRIGVPSPDAVSVLKQVIYSDLDYGNYAIKENTVEALAAVGAGSLEAFNTLLELGAIGNLAAILQGDLFGAAVANLNIYLQDSVYKKCPALYHSCSETLWHCAQNMTYPGFHQAWHPQDGVEKTTTPDHQSLNQADLPQSLHSAITNDPQLSQIIHLICIDGSQFIEPDRPAAEIYDQMLDQNCPECDPVPETMPALKLYWNSIKRNSDKRVVLVFYASSTDATQDKDTAMPCPYSEAFLTVLSKFGREICVITEQRFDHSPLKFFAPSQTIEDVVEWIRVMVVVE